MSVREREAFCGVPGSTYKCDGVAVSKEPERADYPGGRVLTKLVRILF